MQFSVKQTISNKIEYLVKTQKKGKTKDANKHILIVDIVLHTHS